ncbi:glycosyltransferase family 4 protein [Candidatus Daviesbacteria bacterium]|nr:glycosyltransferase family 4 protein [Candidatus Daviesbacteria bacterium]
MKIWIDAKEANVRQRLGSSQVAFGLLQAFEKIDHGNEYTIVIPSAPLEDFPKQRNNWSYKLLRPSKLWTRIALPISLYTSKQKPDLIFSPTHYIPRFSPVKRVVTIFDLGFLHFPETFKKRDLWQLKNWTKFSAEFADHIITISNSSAKDIVKTYGVRKDKITVAYPGYDKNIFSRNDELQKSGQVLKKYGIDGQFIIYVGTIQPRKNLVRLMEAFSRIENLKLVIVGKTKGLGRAGWKYEETLITPQRLGIEDKVIFTGFIPTEELPFLISNAVAMIQPSLWEGFGIPVLESMACGTPVLVSNLSSLPEIVGDAGLTFDPYSTDQMEQAIRTISTDKKIRQSLSKKGLEQVKKFSWDNMAKIVLKVFKAVTTGHPEYNRRTKGIEGSL